MKRINICRRASEACCCYFRFGSELCKQLSKQRIGILWEFNLRNTQAWFKPNNDTPVALGDIARRSSSAIVSTDEYNDRQPGYVWAPVVTWDERRCILELPFGKLLDGR